MEQPAARAIRLAELLRVDRLEWLTNTPEGIRASDDPDTLDRVIDAYSSGWVDALRRTDTQLHDSERI